MRSPVQQHSKVTRHAIPPSSSFSFSIARRGSGGGARSGRLGSIASRRLHRLAPRRGAPGRTLARRPGGRRSRGRHERELRERRAAGLQDGAAPEADVRHGSRLEPLESRICRLLQRRELGVDLWLVVVEVSARAERGAASARVRVRARERAAS